jgi:hypothetical protein
MANKYPYVASAGPLVKTVEQLRKSFPKDVTSETLRKLGVAPQNESYVINILRFLNVIDEEGKKVDEKAKAFVQHQDDAFQQAFGEIVREAYAELFDLRGEEAWSMDRPSLTQFFRTSDHSTEIVGVRQAGTFQHLAALSGHGELRTVPQPKVAKKSQSAKPRSLASKEKNGNPPPPPGGGVNDARVGLTVRIEVNLPAEGDQETYDNIFRSIRKNLIDGS